MFFKKKEVKENFSTHFFREDLKLFFLYNLSQNIKSINLPNIEEYSDKTFEILVDNKDNVVFDLVKTYKQKVSFTCSVVFDDFTLEFNQCLINKIDFPVIENENQNYLISVKVEFVEELLTNNDDIVKIYG